MELMSYSFCEIPLLHIPRLLMGSDVCEEGNISTAVGNQTWVSTHLASSLVTVRTEISRHLLKKLTNKQTEFVTLISVHLQKAECGEQGK
jgi:hypothetical protein